MRADGRCECEGECNQRLDAASRHTGPCEARHREPHPATRSTVYLTVAHLDHTPENCTETNLKAMCQACHLGYDNEHHTQTRRESIAAEKAAWMTPLFQIEAS